MYSVNHLAADGVLTKDRDEEQGRRDLEQVLGVDLA